MTDSVQMFQQRPEPLGDILQGPPRQPERPQVQISIEVTDTQVRKAGGVRTLEVPGAKMSGLPQQGIDRRRGQSAMRSSNGLLMDSTQLQLRFN